MSSSSNKCALPKVKEYKSNCFPLIEEMVDEAGKQQVAVSIFLHLLELTFFLYLIQFWPEHCSPPQTTRLYLHFILAWIERTPVLEDQLSCLNTCMNLKDEIIDDSCHLVTWKANCPLYDCIKDEFTGYSCLLVTWKTNPEVEQFKVLE